MEQKSLTLKNSIADIFDLVLPNGVLACPFKEQCGPSSNYLIETEREEEVLPLVFTCHTPLYHFCQCYVEKKKIKPQELEFQKTN